MTTAAMWYFRIWSLGKDVVDVPNERSSHHEPTPRGGGIVIVATVLGLLAISQFWLDRGVPIAYFVGAILIAVISWLDDLSGVRFWWRLAVHLVAAALVIWGLGSWDLLWIPLVGNTATGYFGIALTVIWIVWLTNAFNFMDGIDGIAGVQALTAGAGWAVLGAFYGDWLITIVGGLIAASAAGFLLHNWQPAKVFMGDVGSAFLGLTFAVIPLLAANSRAGDDFGPLLPVIAILMVWLFVFDSILTFLRRLLNRERVWRPHRKHLYQRMVINGWSHQTVSLLYGVVSALIVTAVVLWAGSRSVSFVAVSVVVAVASVAVFFLQFPRPRASA